MLEKGVMSYKNQEVRDQSHSDSIIIGYIDEQEDMFHRAMVEGLEGLADIHFDMY